MHAKLDGPKPWRFLVLSHINANYPVQENHTYHAYAWLKLFNFTKAYNKSMTTDDVKLMASSVVLSTLSIVPYDRQEQHQDEVQVEQDKERIVRMANILGFAVVSELGVGGA